VRARLAELESIDYAPPPLVTGDDLVSAGLQPGPAFKKVLERTYDEQLEGRVATREAAMAFAMGLAKG
jgi:poly(A) polymerase